MKTQRVKKKKIASTHKIGWGIIGSSSFADHTFAPAIKEAKGAELRSVLAPSRFEAEEFCRRHKIKGAHYNLAEFLADKATKAIWIAAPTHMHKEFAIAALKAGKHVLCEKPMAVTTTDCRAMITAAKRARRKLHIAYNTRHHPKIQVIQKDWMSGRFGKPVHGRCHLYYPYSRDVGHRTLGRNRGWHSSDAKVGGWAYGDVGTHLIDQLRWFLGDAKKLIGSHNTSPTWGYKTPDHAVAMIAFKNGSVGTISASTGLTPGKGRLEFYGEDGYIIIEGGLLGEEGSLTTGITNFRKTKSGHGTTRIAKEKTTILSATNTYRLQVEAFGDTITRGRSYPLTPEDGLANIKLISAARGW